MWNTFGRGNFNIYYGAADDKMYLATTTLEEVKAAMEVHNGFKTVNEITRVYNGENIVDTYKLKFLGDAGYDVYNQASPFLDNGKMILAGRVEKCDSERTKIMFFEQVEKDTWKLLTDYSTFDLQDPYFSFVGERIVLGETEIFEHPENSEDLWWCAKKLVGKNVASLEHLAYGQKGEIRQGRFSIVMSC